MSSDLSPPPDTAKALDDLSDTTGALIDAFDDIIRLPFVDAFRVDELGDKSIADVILDLKKKYQALQGNTLPFARDLFGYSAVQIQTIPMINDSLPLRTYLDLNKVIIARHKLEATQVKKESEAFRKTFAATLDIFENTIKELAEQIQDLNTQIQETKDLQEKEKTVAIIAGVLVFVFTVAAVLAIFATGGAAASGVSSATSTVAVQGSAASAGFFTSLGASIGVAGTSGLVATTAAFGSAAVASLAETIVSSIEAGNFGQAIKSLESLRDSAETSRNQLIQVIDLMQGVETSLDEIVTVWTEVEGSLGIIQSDVDNWSEENFSQELAADTVEEWEDVRSAIEKYTAVVSGERSSRSAEKVKEPPQKLTGDEVNVIAKSLAIAELKQNLQAPDLEFSGKLSDFKQSRTALEAAKSLPGVGSTLVSQVETAEKYLTQTEQGMASSLSELVTLSKDRQIWLEAFAAQEGQQAEMINDLILRAEKIESSIATAQENESKAFSFQASVGLVNNTLIRLIAEKNASQQVLTKELKSLERDRKRRKWLWVVPIAGAINEIVDAANNIKGKIKRLQREIGGLSKCRVQLQKISGVVSSSVKDTTLISQAYSQILNDSRACADNVILFETLREEIPTDLVVSVKESWAELENDIVDLMG